MKSIESVFCGQFTIVFFFCIFSLRSKSFLAEKISYLLAFVFILIVTFCNRNQLFSFSVILKPFSAFETILLLPWRSHGRYVFRGLIGNILLLFPFGLLLSRYEGKCYKYFIPFLISLTIETIQYFTRLGTFEVDDLICNTIGGILGYELGKQMSGQRKGNFLMPGIYLAALGLCCLKSILFN